MWKMQCETCRHFITTPDSSVCCSAFSKGIPVEIAAGKFSHDRHYPGDGGIRFEEARNGLEPLLFWEAMPPISR